MSCGNNIKSSINMRHDMVNHPDHYCCGGIETIDYIRAKLSPEEYRGYLKGSVIKYLSRAGHKGDEKEDLEKARWYLDRMIHDAVGGRRDGKRKGECK